LVRTARLSSGSVRSELFTVRNPVRTVPFVAGTVLFLLRPVLERSYAATVSTAEDAMRHSEYERRRRALEMQFREDIELLRAGYQAKLRALEMLWFTSPGEALPAEPAAHESIRLSETVTETLSARETLPEPPPPARQRGQALEDITASLPELPEVFDQRDLVRVLGYTPPRGTLHRVFGQLLRDKLIVMDHHSIGPIPTRYRKLPEPLDAGGDRG
jgi:hypothetical protein